MKTYYSEIELEEKKMQLGFLFSFEFTGKFDDDEAINRVLAIHGNLVSRTEVAFEGLLIAAGHVVMQPIFGIVNSAKQTVYWTYIHGVENLAAFNKVPSAMDIVATTDVIRGFYEKIS